MIKFFKWQSFPDFIRSLSVIHFTESQKTTDQYRKKSF